MIGEKRLIYELREMILKDECKNISSTETIYKIIRKINDLAGLEASIEEE